MNHHELKKKAIEEAMREHVTQISDIRETARKDGNREFSDDENRDVASHVKSLEDLKVEKANVEESIKTLERVDEIGRSLGPAVSALSGVSVGSDPISRQFDDWNRTMFPQAQKTLGEQFVSSKGYKGLLDQVKEQGGFGGEWSTGPVALDLKGTLLEGLSSPGSGSGGGLLPVPQTIPGVVETLFQPLTISDLLLSGQASGNTLRYVVEGTATSGAAGVAEAGTKPESTLGLSTKDEPIKKIATLLPVSEEMLEDAPAIQSYINGRLTLFVRIEEERQLARGSSGGNEVQGILTSRGVPVFTGSTADDKATQLFKGLNSMRGSAFIEPEWIVMHPTDWQTVRLLKDNSGQFYGGGPFTGAYGGPQGPVSTNSQLRGVSDSIWQLPVHVTAAIGGAGTALVGSRANAQVWRRGGLSVEASNSHASFFQINMIALRAEERLGLAVYRPAGYVEVRIN